MNLKEAFRYQSYLNDMCYAASQQFAKRDRCINVVKTHLKHKANPDDMDEEEIVVSDSVEKYTNEDLLRFMETIINEKERITAEINYTKHTLSVSEDFDVDALIEANKIRRRISTSINSALAHSPKERKEKGTGFKFNLEGNQVPYSYEIEIKEESSFDRDNVRHTMKKLNEKADKVSSLIDMALVNGRVDHVPIFDVNDSFEDAVCSFVENHIAK